MFDAALPARAESASYRVYGITLATRFLLCNHLLPGSGAPDVTFDVTHRSPFSADWDDSTPAYNSSFRLKDGRSVARLYPLPACDLLRVTDVADYYIQPDLITCHLLNASGRHLVEIHLLGAVLSLWLERRGVPALHASAVEVNGRAIGFLAQNKGGKSALAATLVQAGFPLLADDVLAVEARGEGFRAHPAYPSMRLWPSEAAHFLGGNAALERVLPHLSKLRVPVGAGGFGAFCETSLPMACLYLPQRRDPEDSNREVEIRPVPPREALMELVRASFVARMVDALQLQRSRFNVLAHLAQAVPVRRVVYPHGHQHLPAVRAAVLSEALPRP